VLASMEEPNVVVVRSIAFPFNESISPNTQQAIACLEVREESEQEDDRYRIP